MATISTRKKVGLALGGGAARGLAHIGVLRVLEKEGIPIDMIAGTSAGSAVGALYAKLRDAAFLKKEAMDRGWTKWAPMIDPALPRSGLLRGKRIIDMIGSYMGGDTDFSSLHIPFACVATDIRTGEEVVMDKGSVLEAVRASISIPVIFTASRWEKHYLVDGGLVNPVPVSVVKRMGADFIIAVNVIPDVADYRHHLSEEELKKMKEPNIFISALNSIYITTYALVKSSLKMADVAIEPHVAHFGVAEFHRAADLIYLGEIAARDALPDIEKKLAATAPIKG